MNAGKGIYGTKQLAAAISGHQPSGVYVVDRIKIPFVRRYILKLQGSASRLNLNIQVAVHHLNSESAFFIYTDRFSIDGHAGQHLSCGQGYLKFCRRAFGDSFRSADDLVVKGRLVLSDREAVDHVCLSAFHRVSFKDKLSVHSLQHREYRIVVIIDHILPGSSVGIRSVIFGS